MLARDCVHDADDLVGSELTPSRAKSLEPMSLLHGGSIWIASFFGATLELWKSILSFDSQARSVGSNGTPILETWKASDGPF